MHVVALAGAAKLGIDVAVEVCIVEARRDRGVQLVAVRVSHRMTTQTTTQKTAVAADNVDAAAISP
eukprot:scaffold539_cov359-Prasinococcus_capsulatus_cf.AAC.39